MNVKVIGPHRTGSTIIQNIGYFIINKKKGRLQKTHIYEYNKNLIYLVTIRDPREMVISIKRNIIDGGVKNLKITDLTFLSNSKITKDLDNLLKIYSKHKESKNSLILKFEDIYPSGLGNYDFVINKISNFLNINTTIDDIQKIKDELNYKKLKKISDNIKYFNKNDVNTTSYGLHGNHISSKNTKTWNEIVDVKLHDKFNELLLKYIKETDYKYD
jgi:hypothetical protein